MKLILFFTLAIFTFFTLAKAGEALRSATVIEMHNEVVIRKEGEKERSAQASDTVIGTDILRTGKKSRAELEFADKSIARLGSNTIFSFDAKSREMKIDRGTALIHVPPGLSGARIATPAATAAILGDVVAMRVSQNGTTQIVALSRDSEGPINVTFNKTGETRTLEPGQLLTLDPLATHMPEPETINVQAFTQTSSLIKSDPDSKGFKTELPESAKSEIRHGEELQKQEIKNGNLEGPVGQILPTMRDNSHDLPRPTTTLIEASNSSRFAGTFIGIAKDTDGCANPTTVNFTLHVNEDGRFIVQGVNHSGRTFTAFGTVDENGALNFTKDGPDTRGGGSVTIQGNSITGLVTHGESGDNCSSIITGARK